MARTRDRKHTVRPRWTWLGLAVLIVGVVVLGVGVMVLTWPTAVAGVVLILAGGAAVVYGGLYYDTHASADPSEIIEAVKTGDTHEEPGPDSLLGDRRLRQTVAMETRHNELVRTQEPAVPLVESRVSVGSGILIGIGAWLALGSMWIYPTSVDGQFGSTRDAFFGFLTVACGLRLKLGNTGSMIASGIAVLAGLLMLAFGLLAGQSAWGAQAQEIFCGLVILVGAAMSGRR